MVGDDPEPRGSGALVAISVAPSLILRTHTTHTLLFVPDIPMAVMKYSTGLRGKYASIDPDLLLLLPQGHSAYLRGSGPPPGFTPLVGKDPSPLGGFRSFPGVNFRGCRLVGALRESSRLESLRGDYSTKCLVFPLSVFTPGWYMS